PRELVAVQLRVPGIAVLELALQREVRLTRQMTDALGAARVVGGEVVVGQPGGQRGECRRPAEPRVAGDITHRSAGCSSSVGSGAKRRSVSLVATASASIG